MAGRLDKVQARVDAVVDYFLSVDAVLLLEVGVEARLDIVENGLPATRKESPGAPEGQDRVKNGIERHLAHPSSLLIKSPNPGVSTTVRRSLTPFSSMSAEMLSIATVCGRSWCGCGTSFSG